MDLNEKPAPAYCLISLNEMVSSFGGELDRESPLYAETMDEIATLLNQLERGALKAINIDDLRLQTGSNLKFFIKDLSNPIPYDLSYINKLRSHFRNPTILVLRRIRKFLLPIHRKLLAALEDDQNRERQINFKNLDIDRKVKENINEMQRFQTMAQLTRSTTRKLDILTRAVCVPRYSKRECRLLNGILDDVHHLRHASALNWLTGSSCRGDLPLMNRIIEKGMWVLDRKSERILEEMTNLTGLPFRDDETIAEAGNWYSLTAPVRRGDEFLSIFNAEEQVETQIRKVTFFVIQSAYHAGKFNTLIEQNQLDYSKPEKYGPEMSALFFEIGRCIVESGHGRGEALMAVASDEKFGLLSQAEAEAAREWIGNNRMALQGLKLKVFNLIFEFRKGHPGTALPQEIEEMIETEREQLMMDSQPNALAELIPQIPIRALASEMEQYQVEAVTPDGNLLEALCEFHQRIMSWRDHLSDNHYHRQLREICEDFSEYERHLMTFAKLDEELSKVRTECEELVERVYHTIYLGHVSKGTLQTAFNLVLDHILNKVRLLDYHCLEAENYQKLFDRALGLEGNLVYVQLDQLFRELHALPRQSQLIHALTDWEGHLDRETLIAKQGFIVENEFQIQELVDQVRCELRERLIHERIDSQRLRFDVFSLSDCYAGNLETGLEALLRTIPKLASDMEGENLMESLQALEAQVIEAQRVTRPEGEAFRKLRDLERSKLLPTSFLEDLRQDLTENFSKLDALLETINEELRKVRRLQNRFGGDHDTQIYSLAINLYDLEQLKKIYHFVENISLVDLKRFGLVYNHKNAMMEDLLRRASQQDPTIVESIKLRVNPRVYKAFRESKNIPLDLKILILWEVPEILEAEAELVVRLLNFVEHQKLTSKTIYTGTLQILENAKGAAPTTLAHLKRIWSYYLEKIQNYHPSHYIKNYTANKHKLLEDVSAAVGKALD